MTRFRTGAPMSKTEKQVEKDILSEARTAGDTLYRNNNGILKAGARWVSFGLKGGTTKVKKGSSDYIGYTSVKITPAMVGKTVAVFVACEVKKPGGTPSAEQVEFTDTAAKAGAIAFIADSVIEYKQRMKSWKTNIKRRKK